MQSSDVARIVRSELDGYSYEASPSGSTVGVPWSEEKVRSYLPRLEAALVDPYLQDFFIRDTWEQVQANPSITAEYWVVAEAEFYIVYFDAQEGLFGLAEYGVGSAAPHTINVRGDLVGVFC